MTTLQRVPASEPPSETLPPPTDIAPYRWGDGSMGQQMTVGPYAVVTRNGWPGDVLPCGTKAKHVMLQVSRHDGGSVFDWRDLQQIKTLVLGAEWEAIELFPAESRLVDPSNARYLWARSRQFAFGIRHGRVVSGAGEFAPQRPFQE